jgi:hypothetical protein
MQSVSGQSESSSQLIDKQLNRSRLTWNAMSIMNNNVDKVLKVNETHLTISGGSWYIPCRTQPTELSPHWRVYENDLQPSPTVGVLKAIVKAAAIAMVMITSLPIHVIHQVLCRISL